jgi:hypothetical protein
MGKAIRASVLVLLLVCSAKAGWIHNPVTGTPPPPPPPAVTEQEPTASGEMQNGAADAADSLMETLLSALENVFALF